MRPAQARRCLRTAEIPMAGQRRVSRRVPPDESPTTLERDHAQWAVVPDVKRDANGYAISVSQLGIPIRR